MNKPTAFSVTQLNDYVKALVDSSEVLCNVCVAGEISNFTNHYKTGHLYFTLKDENSLLKCVMFRTYAQNLTFKPENNMKVLVYGRISVFTRDGVYQLYAEYMEPFGVGELYAAFERMKKKLLNEGLFDDAFKKPIPKFPRRIGIITSPKAAAAADMKNIITRRYPLCEIHIYPALVQGKDAPAELCRGIVHFDNDENCDTIIIGRGGGSIEDLWAFNDEMLARTIFKCKTPVISAVGHETDFTICDFVADLRAPTPSAAAELAVPDSRQLKMQLQSNFSRIYAAAVSLLNLKTQKLNYLKERPSLKRPEYYFEAKTELLSKLDMSISSNIKRILELKQQLVASNASRLSALNPMGVLARGYSAVFDNQNRVVSSVKQVKENDMLTLNLVDGKIFANVEKTQLKEEK